jgi:hypothetical protein
MVTKRTQCLDWSGGSHNLNRALPDAPKRIVGQQGSRI